MMKKKNALAFRVVESRLNLVFGRSDIEARIDGTGTWGLRLVMKLDRGRIGGVTGLFFFSSRRRHTRSTRDWSSDVCSSDLLCCARDPSATLGFAAGAAE